MPRIEVHGILPHEVGTNSNDVEVSDSQGF